jgi:hypothetical protein
LLDFMQGPSGTPYCLGLTGSIGMGKTTIGGMFRDLQVPVLEADATVHELYAKGGAAVPVVKNMFPDAVVNGKCRRSSVVNVVSPVITAVRRPCSVTKLGCVLHKTIPDQSREPTRQAHVHTVQRKLSP